jgi:hypothetical protein
LDDLAVDGRIISKWVVMKLKGGVDLIGMNQERSRSLSLLNAAMNLRVPKNAGTC